MGIKNLLGCSIMMLWEVVESKLVELRTGWTEFVKETNLLNEHTRQTTTRQITNSLNSNLT